MKFKFNILVFISFLFIITTNSCRKELNISIKDSEKKIVLNSVICADTTIKLNLTRSLHIQELSSSLLFISNAKVYFYEEDILIDTLEYISFGNYYLNFKPSNGKKYKIITEVSGLQSTVAQCDIPIPVPITKVDTTSVRYLNEYGDIINRIKLDVKISDPENKKNYYLIDLRFRYFSPYDSTFLEFSPNYETEDVMFDDNNSISFNNNQVLLFSDDYFEGNDYIITLLCEKFSPNGNLIIRLYSVNEDLYKYLMSYNLYQNTDNPFSESVQVYSNINNGLGIFGSYSMYCDTIKWKGNNNIIP